MTGRHSSSTSIKAKRVVDVSFLPGCPGHGLQRYALALKGFEQCAQLQAKYGIPNQQGFMLSSPFPDQIPRYYPVPLPLIQSFMILSQEATLKLHS